MRYSPEHTEAIRARIVETTSRLLRKSGLDGASIPKLMKQVGMTHGGFYSHFDDRDELVAEAVRFSAEQTGARIFDSAASLREALAAYLSPEHVAHPEAGCVVAALGAEGPRQSASVRKAFAHAARGLIRLVQQKRSLRSVELSNEAIATASRMVGAVVLARLVDDPTLARRILEVAQH